MNEITHWEGCWLAGRAHYSCAITHIASLTVRAERLQAELAEAHGYGSRLFLRLNPQCEVFDNMPGLMTQFDNYIAGQLQDIAAEKAARERAEQEVVRLREALIAVDEWDLNWADGLDANVEKIKSMARAALEG